MDNKGLITISVIILILTIAPYLIYYLHFLDGFISDKPNIWGEFGNFLNGALAPIVALVGLLITYVLRKNTEKNNALANRPLVFVSLNDYDNFISLNIHNKGLGPAIIKDYKIINKDTKREYSSTFEILNDAIPETITLDNFTGNHNNLVLSPGEKRNIFRLRDDHTFEGDIAFDKAVYGIRNAFKHLQFQIKYQDVYGKEMDTYYKNLDWYGRHFEKETTLLKTNIKNTKKLISENSKEVKDLIQNDRDLESTSSPLRVQKNKTK